MSEAETIGEALDLSEIRLEMPGYVELVLSLVLIWGFGDAVSTLVAATFAGPSLEANPWIRLLLVHHPLLMVALKAAVALYAGVVLLECRSVVERVPGWRAWFLGVIGLGTAVVVTNVYVGLVAVAAV
ncbi:hypothetical protein [Halosimplex pelagicum]|uniref:DUF5658 domain-containing protein n=1 Tax=Halosimplex pelagicum TaxID=869886 RepID=A0A7D5TT15_9EURY|nr:hypothetical protein [Halosimplex pelagicum]QLH81034.1 hypothetical protein HZS54_05005 [Halosimplex pelagicum]